MSEICTISIARDFSRYPGGRFIEDGKNSAERFKKELLLPALEKHETVEIDFEEIAGCGASFLEETFGGLIRDNGFSAEEIYKRIILKTRQSRIEEIHSYIDAAQKKKNNPVQQDNKSIPLPEYLKNFFDKLNQENTLLTRRPQYRVRLELNLDLNGNVVKESKNKAIITV